MKKCRQRRFDLRKIKVLLTKTFEIKLLGNQKGSKFNFFSKT